MLKKIKEFIEMSKDYQVEVIDLIEENGSYTLLCNDTYNEVAFHVHGNSIEELKEKFQKELNL